MGRERKAPHHGNALRLTLFPASFQTILPLNEFLVNIQTICCDIYSVCEFCFFLLHIVSHRFTHIDNFSSKYINIDNFPFLSECWISFIPCLHVFSYTIVQDCVYCDILSFILSELLIFMEVDFNCHCGIDIYEPMNSISLHTYKKL